MLTRKISADLVVFFKTLPTRRFFSHPLTFHFPLSLRPLKTRRIVLAETVKQFGDGIVQVLRQSATQPNEIFGVVPRDYGCDIGK